MVDIFDTGQGYNTIRHELSNNVASIIDRNSNLFSIYGLSTDKNGYMKYNGVRVVYDLH